MNLPAVKHDLTPEKIQELEIEMLRAPQIECEVSHHFGPGIYIRELHVPAGTYLIGHHQNIAHLNSMVKGRVKMLADDGEIKELVAPVVYTAKPGRKIGIVLEDMIWQNIYPTTETDVEKLEAKYLTKSDDWMKDQETKQRMKYLEHHADREDYKAMLEDIESTHELVKTQFEGDLVDMPKGTYNIMTGDSQIEGKGLFATSKFSAGDLIAPASIEGMYTRAGRYANHSRDPNAKLILLDNNVVVLEAIKTIEGCHGGQPGDEITIDYRQRIKL